MTNDECIAQLESDGYAVSKPATRNEMARQCYNGAYNYLEALAEWLADGAYLEQGGADFTTFLLKRLRTRADKCMACYTPQDELPSADDVRGILKDYER